MRKQNGRQIFGSALAQPWALILLGGNADHRTGRRPPTRVAYLSDPLTEAEGGGFGGGFLGGIVEFYRAKDEPCARWHFAYSRPKRFNHSEVLYRFPHAKARASGPTLLEVGRAKRALPKSSPPLLEAAPAPCGSCPYRRDVPSGIWAAHEYEKLPGYDGETWEQSPAVFLCHRRDGRLCGGWLACHDPQHLLALRIQREAVDPAVFEYKTDVPVFASGAEAREHGLRDLAEPGEKANRMIAGLVKKQEGE